MPASLIILPHLPSWSLTKASSSADELENASKPTLPRLDFTSGLSMILRSAALSSVMMSEGVPAGAKMAAQESMSKPLTPASSSVGSSGKSVERATTPEVLPLAKDNLPGLDLAYSISSVTDLAGMLG